MGGLVEINFFSGVYSVEVLLCTCIMTHMHRIVRPCSYCDPTRSLTHCNRSLAMTDKCYTSTVTGMTLTGMSSPVVYCPLCTPSYLLPSPFPFPLSPPTLFPSPFPLTLSLFPFPLPFPLPVQYVWRSTGAAATLADLRCWSRYRY